MLIDDARKFGKAPDYPTIDEIENSVCTADRPHHIGVKDDIIRIIPKSIGTEDGRE